MPPPEWPTRPTRSPGRKLQVEVLENLLAVAVAEIDMLELHAGAAAHQRLGLRMVAQLVRHQQRRHRLRQPRDVLRDVDQRHREVARRVQHRERQRAGEHDVAGRRLALLPEHDRPGEQAERQHDGHDGVKDAQLLEIEQAAPPRVHLAIDGRVEAAMLAGKAAERPHQRHVADDVDHFAVDGGGLVGEVVMQRPAGGGEAEHQAHHDAGDNGEAGGHRQADGADQRDRRDRRRARRQHVPDEHVLGGEDRVRGRGHAARQRAGQAVGEIGRRMARSGGGTDRAAGRR